MEGGRRNIYLGQQSGRNADLHYGIVLSHEAMRNGTADGQAGQERETAAAVLNHTLVARSVAAAYGGESLSGTMQGEVKQLNRALASGDFSGFGQYIAGNYDSSGDYWRLTLDNKIVWDNSRDLNVEYVDPETGEVKVEEKVRVDKTGSYSKSLENYLGRGKTVAFLESHGIKAEGMSDSEIAYALMTSSGAEWNQEKGIYEPITIPGGQGYNTSSLSDRLTFEVDEGQAFHMRKISQETPSIGYWVGEGDDRVNVMATTGCYYLSTLGAVQTQAGEHLTAEQINKITEISLENDWLETDENSIYPKGNLSRTEISRLAFEELGIPARLDFVHPQEIDGLINVGETVNGNNHATEWGSEGQLFDPYEGIKYNIPTIERLKREYEYIDEYQEYYWREYEQYYR
jgi:hypothetical protein